MPTLLLLVLAIAGCGGVDEVVPAIDAAIIDAPDPVDAVIPNPGLPDIALVESLMTGSIQIDDLLFGAESCELQESCVGAPGLRRLLRFTTVTENRGPGDLYFGSPVGNPLFEFSDCHEHHHFSGYASYQLVDGDGVVVTGHKQAFCLLDSIQMDAEVEGPRYSCTNQGITAGWADSYTSFLPCQWIDITGVTPGMYTLRITVNPMRVFEETDYTNNVLELPVTF